MEALRKRFDQWRQTRAWRGSLDYPYYWVEVQWEALFALEKALAGEDVSDAWTELTRRIEKKANVPLLQRHMSHQVAEAGAKQCLVLLQSVLKGNGHKPKKPVKMEVCLLCGWKGKRLTTHMAKMHKKKAVIKPEPEIVEVDAEAERRVKKLTKKVRSTLSEYQEFVRAEGGLEKRGRKGIALRKAWMDAKVALRKAREELKCQS